ncbi:hypothetical protein STSP2_01057 [Anaerohalosphaera lusitana]|uniref:Uncharacterized protein n=1 Tax=Anaerohalosphaera lusitana TaxID=1936003 RepID=A0A1U9NJB1_9BACT|nr:helix-turn-helix transcriptional regulator [Anaerohalosphaera lusitana]AQT67905.1 hypothetical protein STSP2_01057 [Anaerohalosphaera lusitana]
MSRQDNYNTLGQAVKEYRGAMTQGDLARRMTEDAEQRHYPTRPDGKADTVSQSWISRLEDGKLKRDVSEDRRRWIARVLGADEDLFLRLPIAKQRAGDEHARTAGQTSYVIDFAKKLLSNLEPGSDVWFDSPLQEEPLSARKPEALWCHTQIITEGKSRVFVFSSERERKSVLKMPLLLAMVLGKLENDEDVETDEIIAGNGPFDDSLEICREVVTSFQRWRSDPITLSGQLFSFLQERLVLYHRTRFSDVPERPNPLTLIVVRSDASPTRRDSVPTSLAILAYGLGWADYYDKSEEWVSYFERAIEDGAFTPVTYSKADIAELAENKRIPLTITE